MRRKYCVELTRVNAFQTINTQSSVHIKHFLFGHTFDGIPTHEVEEGGRGEKPNCTNIVTHAQRSLSHTIRADIEIKFCQISNSSKITAMWENLIILCEIVMQLRQMAPLHWDRDKWTRIFDPNIIKCRERPNLWSEEKNSSTQSSHDTAHPKRCNFCHFLRLVFFLIWPT